MAHTCQCGTGSGTCSAASNRTVGEVSRDVPGALELLKARGINHCCGAALTLKEAAAAAGTPLDDLLGALQALEQARP